MQADLDLFEAVGPVVAVAQSPELIKEQLGKLEMEVF